jgi:hypothetical protein
VQKLPYNWGWNTQQDVQGGGGQMPQGYPAMPATTDLDVPIIFLNFGPGLGLSENNPTLNTNVYDYVFNFPTGAYPGQKVTVMFKNQSATWYGHGVPAPIIRRYYGNIMLRIPAYRIKVPNTAASYSSWYRGASAAANGYAAGFHTIQINTSLADSNKGTGLTRVFELIWDGTESTQTGRDTTTANPQTPVLSKTQLGWHIVSDNADWPIATSNNIGSMLISNVSGPQT